MGKPARLIYPARGPQPLGSRDSVHAFLRQLVPGSTRTALHRMLASIRHYGTARQCPVCGASLRAFLPYGDPPREEALCPVCDSLERHRLVWLYFQARLLDGRPKRMLHVAPEREFVARLRRALAVGYVTSDLMATADVRVDICHLPYSNAAFDVVYASHVLEHVPDDLQAMREFRRVLKPTGWALLPVPVAGPRTFEDWSITTPEGRYKAFGQDDYPERLASVGFSVELLPYEWEPRSARFFGLRDEPLWLSRQRS
jgi:SAM-dependent methyltransferase